jgi:hypothetical protein
MESEILRKLDTLLREGVKSEPHAVHLMAAIRKLLEQQCGAKQRVARTADSAVRVFSFDAAIYK